MATIKAIEGASVHQIQSGQVIVDLCSVVKELVENSLDAGATSIDIRFKNSGLDSIEVQDNGAGIAPEDYETIALKHYTSKLSTYNDLKSLTTFGFRGEALSSLCALSSFHIITATASAGPKGTRLDFEISGKLKEKSVVASQKGTIVCVEDIFRNLPVRRRELEKNIKREYGKVLGLLNAYACISTGVKFGVSNVPPKGKKMTVFQTKANPTTRENIANVYGAKTLLALLTLDLELEMQAQTVSTQGARNWTTQADSKSQPVILQGHISRPVNGEGRQTPDRQMFFVNSRPCALPQVAKAINEVYKSYNVTQSPFIFANLKLDTNAYDVNVSPDKRTILLHDQAALLDALKTSLVELFEASDQSVPKAATPSVRKLPVFRALTVARETSTGAEEESPAVQLIKSTTSNSRSGPVEPDDVAPSAASQSSEAEGEQGDAIRKLTEQNTESREDVEKAVLVAAAAKKRRESAKAVEADRAAEITAADEDHCGPAVNTNPNLPRPVQDFNARLGVQPVKPRKPSASSVKDSSNSIEAAAPPEFTTGKALLQVNSESSNEVEETIPAVMTTPQKSTPGVVQNAFDRMRAKRTVQETATITIGNQTTITTIGGADFKRRRTHTPKFDLDGKIFSQASPLFTKSLRAFAAPGTQFEDEPSQDDVNTEPVIRRGAEKVVAPNSSMTATTEDSDIPDLEDEEVEPTNAAVFLASDDQSDDEYIEEGEKKAREEAKVARLIATAEEAAARPTADNMKRATTVMKGKIRKDSTLQLVQYLETSVARIEKSLANLTNALQDVAEASTRIEKSGLDEASESTAEEQLSLTVSKSDFARMNVIGQFNLGFILATRPAPTGELRSNSVRPPSDELFIIDQHASDEKYNFERLQAETIVQNQRLVHPRILELTAIEEEIIFNHTTALAKNGFIIETDTSGDLPVGQRCHLVSLPMSKEVVFNARDLEELLALLAEDAGGHSGNDVPRPGKVRKMFAMRACRSSIMVGKNLTKTQMERVVRHMGKIDKPWNCPHGRPTMRHLYGVDNWSGWDEGDGLVGMEEVDDKTDWNIYLRNVVNEGEEEESDPKD